METDGPATHGAIRAVGAASRAAHVRRECRLRRVRNSPSIPAIHLPAGTVRGTSCARPQKGSTTARQGTEQATRAANGFTAACWGRLSVCGPMPAD